MGISLILQSGRQRGTGLYLGFGVPPPWLHTQGRQSLHFRGCQIPIKEMVLNMQVFSAVLLGIKCSPEDDPLVPALTTHKTPPTQPQPPVDTSNLLRGSRDIPSARPSSSLPTSIGPSSFLPFSGFTFLTPSQIRPPS